MYRLLAKGVRVPVVAGVMPITNAKQVERIFTLSGTPIPSKLRAVVERFGDHPEALRQAGNGVYDGSDHGSDCQRIQPYPCLYDE